MTNSQVAVHESWLVRCSPPHSLGFRQSNPHVTGMSSVCHSYVLVCHSYVTRMYSYVIRMSLVCTGMSFVCHSYVLGCHSYVTRIYSYVIRMSLVFTCMSLVCVFTLSFQNWLLNIFDSYLYSTIHIYVQRLTLLYSKIHIHIKRLTFSFNTL